MRIVITGATGFIGKNLILALKSLPSFEILEIGRDATDQQITSQLTNADVVFHLAAVMRSSNSEDFKIVNEGLTQKIVSILESLKKSVPIFFTSSIQAEANNEYGISKRNAENILEHYSRNFSVPVFIYRLTNTFGPLARPNAHSVIATFCFNLANNLPLIISDPNKEINFIYIEDVIKDFIYKIQNLISFPNKPNYVSIHPVYPIKLGDLAEILRKISVSDRFNPSNNLEKYLYKTYLSYKLAN